MSSHHWIDLESGITQTKRLIQAVLPESVRIDERSMNDLITFMVSLSSEFNYYNLKNEKEGDWSDFFINDFSTATILLSTFDLKKYETEYESQLQQVIATRNPFHKLIALDNLCLYVYNFSQILINFNQRLKYVDTHNINNTLFKELGLGVERFNEHITKLKEFTAQGIKAFGKHYFIAVNAALGRDKTISDNNSLANDVFANGSSTAIKIMNALPTLTHVFHDMVNGYVVLLGIADYYIKGEKINDGNDSPYIGLIKTFLHLYSHLQVQLNNITTKHLDFYYRNLLAIKHAEAVPDQVYVFFSATPAARSVSVKKGDVLISPSGGDDEQLKYAILDNIEITKAQIKSLCTLLISDYLQIPSPDYDHFPIKESQIYCATPAVLQPPFTNIGSMLNWPVLGEDQHDLAENERTMHSADLGFIISSPLFYQQQGFCNFLLRFHFNDTSFKELKAYINNFAQLNKKEVESAMHELFANAFTISYTGLEEWTALPKYAIRFNLLDVVNRSIDISFKLNATNNPLYPYQSKIHGGKYVSDWPSIRCLVNNQASLNAFSYFKLLVLDRLTIKVQVQEANNFTLQNNIGFLNSVAPFMPFGPQPLVGSYIDIKNTNVFNKYTKSFDVDLEWMDLPVTPGGFNDYYAAYNQDINNNSFKVVLNTPNSAEVKKTVEQQKQTFQLFNEVRDENGTIYLNKHTKLGQIDMNRMDMENEMLLSKENILSGATTNKGVIRLELVAPTAAFGHRDYSQKFTEAVMHNAKKSNKVSVPELPYSPMLKSIKINYTLEHTEALHGSGKSNLNKSDFLLYHVFPFGYKKEYPENKEAKVYFLPPLTEAGNLMIGLADVLPEQQLSLFFELKQNQFYDFAFDPENIQLSYLNDNKWLPLGSANVFSDTTNNLISSGIIKIKIPRDIRSTHTILDPSLFWLRASIKEVPRLKLVVAGIFTNAVLAERVLNKDVYTNGQFNLKPNSLTAIEKKIEGIQNIWQPFVSFGGKANETNAQYYTRVSERLRHRNRPQNVLDISQQILEAFPAIFSIKCITKNELPVDKPYQSELVLVVIPRYQQMDTLAAEEPKVELITLYQIKKFIKERISTFIDVQVCNPVYERIKIVATIKFKEGWETDKRQLIKNTEVAIKMHICPWLYDANIAIKLGAKNYLHEILNFLNTLPHVEYVTGFSVLHFYKRMVNDKLVATVMDTAITGYTYIQASEKGAVMLPSHSHIISTIETPQYQAPKKKGIGYLAIGSELVTAAASAKLTTTSGGGNKAETPGNKDGIGEAEEIEEHFTFTIK